MQRTLNVFSLVLCLLVSSANASTVMGIYSAVKAHDEVVRLDGKSIPIHLEVLDNTKLLINRAVTNAAYPQFGNKRVVVEFWDTIPYFGERKLVIQDVFTLSSRLFVLASISTIYDIKDLQLFEVRLEEGNPSWKPRLLRRLATSLTAIAGFSAVSVVALTHGAVQDPSGATVCLAAGIASVATLVRGLPTHAINIYRNSCQGLRMTQSPKIYAGRYVSIVEVARDARGEVRNVTIQNKKDGIDREFSLQQELEEYDKCQQILVNKAEEMYRREYDSEN